MTDPSDPDSWKSLDDCRKEMGGGDWHSSKVFEEMGVAIEHNMSPSMWWSMSETDRAYIVAYERTKSTMTAYMHHQSEKASKRR